MFELKSTYTLGHNCHIWQFCKVSIELQTLAVLWTHLGADRTADLGSSTDTHFDPDKTGGPWHFYRQFSSGREKKSTKMPIFSPDGKVSVELPRSSSSVGASVELPRSAVLKAPKFRQPKSVRRTAKVRSFMDVVLTR